MTFLLAVLLASLSRAASSFEALVEKKPAVDAKACPVWRGSYEEHVRAVYDGVRAVSTYRLKDRVVLRYLPRPVPELLRGAMAAAYAPDAGPNQGNPNPLVVVTEEVFDLCCTRDELAFALAHELAHLELDHPAKLARNNTETFDAWLDPWRARVGAKADALDADAIFAAFMKENKARLDAFQRGLEDEADARAVPLMGQAGYDPGASVRAMRHMRDLDSLYGRPRPGAHDAAASRASKLMGPAQKLTEGKLGLSLPRDWQP